jgi:hypothetical protein
MMQSWSPSIVGGIFFLLYVALIVFIVWQVISALNRISRGVQDIAQTLRRMESRGPQSSSGV